MTVRGYALLPFQAVLVIFAALLSGIAIPVSTAAQNIGAALLLLSFILTPVLWNELKKACLQPFAMTGLALGGALVLAILWTSASPNEAWGFVLKMRAYYLLPLFLVILSIPKAKNALLLGFAAATLLSVVLSCISAWLNYPMFQAIPGDWFIFRSHTYHNYFAALLSTALFAGLLTNKFAGKWKWFALTCIVVLSYDILFLVAGRTGQILYLLMMAMVLLLWNWRWGLLLAGLTVIAGILILPKYSPVIQRGVSNAQADLLAYSHGNANSSVGVRLEWYKNSVKLIQEQPLLGHGTGSFKNEYARISGVIDGPLSSNNPHNDYIWLSIELGLLGAVLLLGLLLSAAWQGRHLDLAWKLTLYAMLFGMGTSTLANSFFTDNITGLAFVLLTCALLNGPKRINNSHD
jgi:O-antigen ligase